MEITTDNDMPLTTSHPDAPLKLFQPPRFACPVHGETLNVISSTLPGHEGEWCQICAVDALDRLGVSRITRIQQDL